MNVGILGGGVSGLALHRFLQHPSEVLEKDAQPGGLCRTFWKDGFGYDIGGHILFSKHTHVTDLVNQLLGDNIRHSKRHNKVLYKGRYIKYPFENDLAALELEDRYDCLIEYIKADFPAPDNLEEWCYATFGKGIADRYLIPYNRKIWKMEPRAMGLGWVERIPKPPMEDVVRSALGITTEGYLHQLYFRYPDKGGFESLVQALLPAEAHGLVCNTAVERIERNGKGWRVVAAGAERHYDHLVSTLPVHEAVRCLPDVPADVRAALDALHYNSMRVALIGVSDESLMTDWAAVYLPDETVLPHRVCMMGLFSPHLVPPGCSSLLAEVTMREGDEAHQLSDTDFLDRVVNDLHRVGIIDKARVTTTDTQRVRYAYPIYDLDYVANTTKVRAYFASLGIDLLGRFAEFDYINSDECIHRALKLAERLNQQSS